MRSAFSVVACLVVLAWVAFSGAGFMDPDAWYHLRAAELAPHGSFPWASASTWATHYADKDWLWHVALRPLVALGLDPYLTGRLATVATAAALLSTLALFAHRRGCPLPYLVAPVALFSSFAFFQRLLLVRPLTLAVLGLVLLVLAAIERRAWLALVVSVLYPLTYTAWFVPVVVGALSRDRKVFALSVLGTSLGLALHPDFPETLALSWEQSVLVLAHAWSGSPLSATQGVEFRSISAFELGRASHLVVLVGLVGSWLALSLDPRVSVAWLARFPALAVGAFSLALPLARTDARTLLVYGSPVWLVLVWLLARALRSAAVATDTRLVSLLAGVSGVAALASARFFEYASPLVTLAAFLLARDVLASPVARSRLELVREAWGPRTTALVGALLLATAAWSGHMSAYATWRVQREAPPARFRTAALWLRAHAAPGEVIFHDRWDAASEFFFFSPELRELVFLDPAFLYDSDEKHVRWEVWTGVLSGRLPPSAARAFGARWIVQDGSYPPSLPLHVRLLGEREAGRAAQRFEDGLVQVWELTQPGNSSNGVAVVSSEAIR